MAEIITGHRDNVKEQGSEIYHSFSSSVYSYQIWSKSAHQWTFIQADGQC